MCEDGKVEILLEDLSYTMTYAIDDLLSSLDEKVEELLEMGVDFEIIKDEIEASMQGAYEEFSEEVNVRLEKWKRGKVNDE